MLIFNIKCISRFQFVVFDDKRAQGINNLYLDQKEFEAKMNEIGPDYLHGNITLEQYKGIISQEKLKNKEICWFLMEQKFFSGIGNYLKAEILYASGILPTRKLCQIDEKEVELLYHNSIKIVKSSYESKGLTIKDYKTPDGTAGKFEVVVYNKKLDPKGNKVLKATFTDKRTTHYVPEVQK